VKLFQRQLLTDGDMAGFGRQRRRDERGAEVAAARKTGTQVSTSHAGWFAALHLCLQFWSCTFASLAIFLSLLPDWEQTLWAVAAPGSGEGGAAPHSRKFIYTADHRRAAAIDACGCRRQPSKPGVFDTRGGHLCLFCLLKNPPRRTGILWPIPPALFPSIIAFRHWAARAQERNLLSAVIFSSEDENFCTSLYPGRRRSHI